MKRIISIICISLYFLSEAIAADMPRIIPFPNHIEIGNEEIKIKGCLTIQAGIEIKNEINFLKKVLAEDFSLQLKESNKAQLTFTYKNGLQPEAYEIDITNKGINIFYTTKINYKNLKN